MITLVHVHRHLDITQATKFYKNCVKLKAGIDSSEVPISEKRKAGSISKKGHTSKHKKGGGVSETKYPTKNSNEMKTITHSSIIDYATRQTNKFIGKETVYNKVKEEDAIPSTAFHAKLWNSYHIYLWVQTKLRAEEKQSKLRAEERKLKQQQQQQR